MEAHPSREGEVALFLPSNLLNQSRLQTFTASYATLNSL